jgi:hypothetical protein
MTKEYRKPGYSNGIALVILIAAQLRKRGRALQSIGVAVRFSVLRFMQAGLSCAA